MDHENRILNRKKLKAVWQEFVKTGKVRPGVVRDEIIESWKRCRSFGLDPFASNIVRAVSQEEWEAVMANNKALIATARPFLHGLYELIKSLEMVVFLTDKDGFILEALGEGDIWKYCQSKNAVVGSSFHEKYCGTNAVSMAIRHNQPYQMIAEEHYLELVHVATCSAAPIHNMNGKVISCLNITATNETTLMHPHTLGMIVAGAQVIENQLRLKKELEKSFLTSQYLHAAMESMESGLVILDKNDAVTHMNPTAEKILRVNISTVADPKIGNIVRNTTVLDAIHDKRELSDHELILGESNTKTRCLVTLKPIFNLMGERIGSVLLLKELSELQKLVQKVVGLHARFTFSDIRGESSAIKECLKLAHRVAKSISNVVILGESGTGKELLAQSIHNAGPFSNGPFLGINCAAIPNDLIESELFGYEAGTFTGGLRSGKPGKLELANGGTLFLDEISEMSLDMQAKLLRVLEEKKFQRLGGREYIFLEARIITATNKNLNEEIEKGNFRSDLFYRLSVLEVKVPPLRERKGDIGFLTDLFIQEMRRRPGKPIIGISTRARAYLESQPWPGNVRQLKNWIERAINLTDGSILALNDFPKTSGVEKKKTSPRPADLKTKALSQIDQVEKDLVWSILKECKSNISESSRRMGVARTTLYRKMKKFNISFSKGVIQ
ncbi:MAG: sigma 54-interacting transcriptional regulator [Pseudomonadota bacterium]